MVSHDLGKYLRFLVRNNGYVLEQFFSPLVVTGQDYLEELRSRLLPFERVGQHLQEDLSALEDTLDADVRPFGPGKA